ncbi:hypothetical protein JOQ06_008934 [Pogonophryne albipinna]|uniref:Uncharacterized protein n=1 Tax=Pogonophryne albipinna TaxID=1090488 RepID=A0AAD6FST0_9TELE|nr:hypothetical protein JOQ06_008934 [Pogonophryne albipinna]
MQLDCMLSVCKDYILEESVNADPVASALRERLGTILPDGQQGKRIAQAYDGAAVMRGAKGGVQRKVKDVYFKRTAILDQVVTIRDSGDFDPLCENAGFVFLLTLFHKIMPCVDMLFNQLQKRNIDSLYIIQRFTSSIQTIRDSIPSGEISGSVQQPPTKNGGHLDMKSNNGWLER